MLLWLMLIATVPLANSWHDLQIVQIVLDIFQESKCRAVVVVSDFGDDDIVFEDFVQQQSYPMTILDSREIGKSIVPAKNSQTVCQNVVIFSHKTAAILEKIYRYVEDNYFIDKLVIVVQSFNQETKETYSKITNQDVIVISSGKSLQLVVWTAGKEIITTYHKEKKLTISRDLKLSGRHVKIATLDYPPYVVIDNQENIRGIEPSLLETMADYLQFTYEFVLASPNEMWGEILGEEGNHTFTGLLGMLARKEVDMACGNLYLSYSRRFFIDYTEAYKINYESFLVPAPKPYDKWKAVFYSFSLSIWIWTIISAFVIIIMLRFVSTWSSSTRRSDVFAELQFCCLYVLGNLLTVQMQPQTILSNANRMFLIWWLFGTLILTTGYKSGLISYMTFPFTPPAIDTIQQLVDSPLKKLVFGEFQKNIIINSSSERQKKLGEALIPIYNLTEMYMLLESGSVAVQSNLDNLLYMAATMYPTTAAGPRVHLMKETILPFQSTFGLQKNSKLKPYFDRGIQHLIESGITNYHNMLFAKNMAEWNPRKANDRTPFSLDSLQGAFYLFTFGVVVSTLIFILEVVCFPVSRR